MSKPKSKKWPGVILVAGGLAYLSIPLILEWSSDRATMGAMGSDPRGVLSWTRDLGGHPASHDTGRVVSVPESESTSVLPQVLSVEDALEWGDLWIILDRRNGKIHFLDPGSGLVESVGREGQGPGELLHPVALARRDSVLWVLNRRGLELARYSLSRKPPSARFHSRLGLRGGGCVAGLAKDLEVLSDSGLAVLRVCPALLPGPGTAFVELIGNDGILSPLLSLPMGTPGSKRIHLLRQPAFTAGRDGFFLGTWDAPCIAVLDRDGRISAHRCLPEYDRPATPRDRQIGLEGRLKWVSDLGLLPVEVPRYLPWYDRAFATAQGLVVRRVRTETERDLVILLPDGETRTTERWFPQNTFPGDETILVAEDLPQGTSISIYPNPWNPPHSHR